MAKFKNLSCRFIAILSVFVVLISLFVLPASATSNTTPDDDIFYDVLEFDSLNAVNAIGVKLPYTANFTLTSGRYRYIDSVITTNISDLTFKINNMTISRYLISYSDGYYIYRFCGDMGLVSNNLRIAMSGTNSTVSSTQIIFNSLKLASTSYYLTRSQLSAVIDAYPFEYSDGSPEFVDPGETARVTLDMNNSYNSYQDFYSHITINDWEAYDYIDVNFMVSASSISSITAALNESYIPYEISYLNTDFENDDSYNDSVVLPRVYLTNVLLRLDLRHILRNGGSIVITINGVYCPWDGENYVQLNSPIGLVCAEAPSSLGAFFRRISNEFTSLKDHLTSLIKPDSDEQAVIDDTNQSLDDFESEIGDLPDVDIDEALPDNSIIDDIADVNPFAEFFRNLIQNPVIYNAMRITLGFCFINFLWFGRR